MEMDSGMYIEEGSILGDKHKVIKILGEGHYAYVFKCLNIETNKMEAVKVSKTKPSRSGMAHKEFAILELLQHLDPDECNIIKYYGTFSHEVHICLRFELLDQSLGAYMEEKHKQGLPMPELRPIIQQLTTALSHLRSVGIVHADIKPDNVMVLDRLQNPLRVKLIDFGLSYPMAAADSYSLMQDMWLKSPEALIRSPYNEAIDMWSLGQTAAELATGIPHYPGDTEYEMLMCEDHEQQGDQYLLVDLINRMLQLDQDERIKFKEVLQHPFFSESLSETSPQNVASHYGASPDGFGTV